MLAEDPQMTRIAPSFLQGDAAWTRPDAPRTISQARWDQYRNLFDRAGVADGVESKAAYNQRLFQQVMALNNPVYITSQDGSFQYHLQTYQFGALELRGLIIFLSSASPGSGNAHAGNCAACHQAPDFSDFVFHKNGVSIDTHSPCTSSRKSVRRRIVFGWTVRLARALIRSWRRGRLMAVTPFS